MREKRKLQIIKSELAVEQYLHLQRALQSDKGTTKVLMRATKVLIKLILSTLIIGLSFRRALYPYLDDPGDSLIKFLNHTMRVISINYFENITKN